jgi:hypothetical protein
VNTIVLRAARRASGRRQYGRTRLHGLAPRARRLRDRTVVILGAGGSARAVGTRSRTAGAHGSWSRIVPRGAGTLASRLADLGGRPSRRFPSRLIPWKRCSGTLSSSSTPRRRGSRARACRSIRRRHRASVSSSTSSTGPTEPVSRARRRARRRTLDGSLMLLTRGPSRSRRGPAGPRRGRDGPRPPRPQASR